MKNPFEVLGIKQGAGKDEIKEAYRTLVKKYHPDQYANHPLASLAQEKMKEINEAYEALMGENDNQFSFNNYSNAAYDDSSPDSSLYRQVRVNIQSGFLEEADRTLDRISNRGAEWNFLKGSVMVRRGWYDQALQHYQIAVNLDPGNQEYTQALNSFGRQKTAYRDVSGSMGYGGSPFECVTKLCIANCCCNCMGGDFFICC